MKATKLTEEEITQYYNDLIDELKSQTELVFDHPPETEEDLHDKAKVLTSNILFIQHLSLNAYQPIVEMANPETLFDGVKWLSNYYRFIQSFYKAEDVLKDIEKLGPKNAFNHQERTLYIALGHICKTAEEWIKKVSPNIELKMWGQLCCVEELRRMAKLGKTQRETARYIQATPMTDWIDKNILIEDYTVIHSDVIDELRDTAYFKAIGKGFEFFDTIESPEDTAQNAILEKLESDKKKSEEIESKQKNLYIYGIIGKYPDYLKDRAYKRLINRFERVDKKYNERLVFIEDYGIEKIEAIYNKLSFEIIFDEENPTFPDYILKIKQLFEKGKINSKDAELLHFIATHRSKTKREIYNKAGKKFNKSPRTIEREVKKITQKLNPL